MLWIELIKSSWKIILSSINHCSLVLIHLKRTRYEIHFQCYFILITPDVIFLPLNTIERLDDLILIVLFKKQNGKKYIWCFRWMMWFIHNSSTEYLKSHFIILNDSLFEKQNYPYKTTNLRLKNLLITSLIIKSVQVF